MSCRVDERVAVGDLERISNQLRAVIGLSKSKVFPNKVFVRGNFSAVDFRVVGRNEQNRHHPQSALQCQGGGDFAHGKGKGKQREHRQVEPKSKRKSAPATRHRPCPPLQYRVWPCTHRTPNNVMNSRLCTRSNRAELL